MQTEMPCIGLGRQISNQKCLSEIAHHLPDDFITMNLFKIKGMLGVAHAMTAHQQLTLDGQEDGDK